MGLLPVLLLVSIASSGVPDSLMEAFESTVRAGFGDGENAHPVGSKPGDLVFKRIQTRSVARLGPKKVVGLAEYTDAATNETRYVEFVVAKHDNNWYVENMYVLDEKQVEGWSAEIPLSMRKSGGERGPGRPGAGGARTKDFIRDPGVEDLDGNIVRISICPKPRCVILFLDPWHPSGVEIAALRGELWALKLPFTIVVTTDQLSEQRRRAQNLGTDVLIDPNNRLRLDTGLRLPYFVVIKDGGEILKTKQVFDFNNLRGLARELATDAADDAAPPKSPKDTPLSSGKTQG